MDPFWGRDITILFAKDKLSEFVPTNSMSPDQILNAVTRFAIYLGILLTLIYKSSTPIYIPLVVSALVYLIHNNYPQMVGGSAIQRPTADNPFMNVLISDYNDNPTRNPAGDVEDPEIKREIYDNFSKGLNRDIDDIWDRNNSQRQYYTNPSTTIPNDRESFMNWCWKTPATCKEGNLTRCLKYEDVRI